MVLKVLCNNRPPEVHNHEIMDTSIMLFVQRPALVILISTMLSYLPHGHFEGWISVNIHRG